MTQTQLAPTLTAKDLVGFDRRRVVLIREMESYGWRGRRGSKQHMILRAPDGVTTTAISKKVISPRDQHNVARDFRAWLRRLEQWAEEVYGASLPADAQMTYPEADATSVLVAFTAIRKQAGEAPQIREPEPVDPEPAPVDTVERSIRLDCEEPGCERDFATLQALSVHKVRVHVKVECRVCDRSMSPSNLPRHQRKHVEQLGTHEEVMREVIRLRAERDRLTDEVAEWQSLAESTEIELIEIQTGMRALLGD